MKYYSCSEIESAVHFYQDKLNFCCVNYGLGKGFIKMIDYTGGPLPFDEMQKAKEQLRSANQDGENAPCAGCPKLELKEWAKDIRQFDFVVIGNYALCNLTCRYCYITSYDGTSRKERSEPIYDVLDSVNQLIIANKLKKEITLVWAGGEPTLYKEFDTVYELLEMNGISASSFIYSNCTIFSPAIYKGLSERKFKLNCSIDSGTAETYTKIKHSNQFEKVKTNLKKYISANSQDVFVKYIILEENYRAPEIESFINTCLEISAKNIFIAQDIFRRPKGEERKENLLSAFAYLAFLAEKNGIQYFYEETVFTKAEVFKAKLMILELLAKSNHTSSASLRQHNLEKLFDSYKNLTYTDSEIDERLEAQTQREIINEGFDEQTKFYLETAENSIKLRKNYTEAVNLYRKALEIMPDNPQILFMLGKALKKLYEYENAVDSFRYALNVDPLNKEIMKELVETYLELGNSAQSFNVLYEFIMNKINDKQLADLSKKIFSEQITAENKV